MKTIEVSTDVYAKIWSYRAEGEETVDDILRRVLAADGKGTKQDQVEETNMKRVLWRDDVKTALIKLGGHAPLAAIYKVVRAHRTANGRSLPTSLDAVVRRELEYNSSDSASYTGKFDWFTSVDGIGGGVWALRV